MPSQKLPAIIPPKGWTKSGTRPNDYDMTLCKTEKHSGSKCAIITSKNEQVKGFGTLMQNIDAAPYIGQRVKLTAYVKTKDLDNWAGLWMRVDAGKDMAAFDNMGKRPIKTDTDWTKYEIILDVPVGSTNIAFGLMVISGGTAWLDDVTISLAGENEKPTVKARDRSCGIAHQNDIPTNLDFCAGLRGKSKDAQLSGVPIGWFKDMWPKDTIAFTSELDKDKKETLIAHIKVTGEKDNGGSLLQAINADKFIGKRLKLCGDLKTDSAHQGAALFFRADAGWRRNISSDYMEGREVKNTTDWQRYSSVIDIPKGSDNIYIGAVLYGEGELWMKNFHLEEVAKETPLTKPKNKSLNSAPVNMHFEKSVGHSPFETEQGWLASGSNPENYNMYSTEQERDGNKINCAIIENTVPVEGGFGTFMQLVEAEPYAGKRVKLNALVKSEDATSAGLWMRIDGPEGDMLGFDNMHGRSIKGNSDWTKYSCVLDVPLGSKLIAFGVLSESSGKVWFTDVTLEEVGKEVPTTNLYGAPASAPTNLNFEE